jgi:hypothetical protein
MNVKGGLSRGGGSIGGEKGKGKNTQGGRGLTYATCICLETA